MRSWEGWRAERVTAERLHVLGCHALVVRLDVLMVYIARVGCRQGISAQTRCRYMCGSDSPDSGCVMQAASQVWWNVSRLMTVLYGGMDGSSENRAATVAARSADRLFLMAPVLRWEFDGLWVS